MIRLVTILTLVIGISAVAQQPSPTQSGNMERKKTAVNVLRLINTAEMNYRAKNKRYGSFQELAGADLLKPDARFAAMWPKDFDVSKPTKPISGLRLMLSPAADGSGYQVAVLSAESGSEPWGFYSNEGGLIFQINPI